MKFDKKLIQVGLVAAIVFGLYLLLGPKQVMLPLPTESKNEILTEIENELNSLQLPMIAENEVYYTDVIAHSSVGRYIEAEALTADELLVLQEDVSLYSYEIASIYRTYEYDLMKGQLTKAEGIYVEMDGEQFVHHYFGADYSLRDQLYGDESILSDWTKKQTYEAPTGITDVTNLVDLYFIGNAIVGFEQYGAATHFPKEEESIGQIFASLFILLFLSGLIVFVTVHLIIALVKKKIEAFWEPFALTVVAAVGWLFVNKAMGVNIMSIGIVESGMMIYMTFVTLLIRWKKVTKPLTARLASLQPAVVHALLLMVIAVLLSELFFFVASYFDTWVSPVTMYNILLELNIWYIPLFTLFIGLSAAITEEAIFRHYMVPLFGRFGVASALVMTSFLWGIMHIGYDMYPWYIYVLEFIVVTGPFFFFVYKRYGFATALFMHYFYNAFVTTLFLFSVDYGVAIASLLVMLSPLLLFFIRHKQDHAGEIM